MRRFAMAAMCTTLIFSSCKKETNTTIVGNWVWIIQYADNPAYNSTPQSTGIQEIISFGTDGTYSLTQNNIVMNSGTYKTSSATSIRGDKISSALYSNNRVTDSVAYYVIQNNNDSLIFSYDLIGTVGSGSRHYGKQK
jgi:hypothetical protein